MGLNNDSSEPVQTLRGTVARIVYANEDNHYTVARLEPEGRPIGDGTVVTIVGQFPALVEGESLLLQGRWQTHKKYGRQFAVESYSSVVPPTTLGIERYLSSRLIKGIGQEFARRIVERFGEATIDIIENHPQRLREVEGIGRKRLADILGSWNEHRAIRDVMVFLQGLGISAAYASRVYKVFGAGAIDAIKANPYCLAAEVDGIGFKTADRIASNLGFPHDAPERVQAGLLYLLGQLAAEGHVCFPHGQLVMQASELLQVELKLVEDAIRAEREADRVVVDDEVEDSPVYLAALWAAEFAVADLLKHIAEADSQLRHVNTEYEIAWAEKQNNIQLAEGQREAVTAALQNKVTIVTGGPGVGKTTIVNCIIRILRKQGMGVLLAAPTGRAAKRLEETTGHKAQTIHRLLKWNPMTGCFTHNAAQPLEADAIIIDETSMMDVSLMRDLLLAVPLTAVLILVGDVDQLPSVGPGNVLRDIIQSGRFPVKRLEQIFRQSDRSPIIWNAHQINHGRMPDLTSGQAGAEQEGFFFIERTTPEEIVSAIKDLCGSRIPNRFGLDPIADIQVMAPMYKGTAGVTNLNDELRACLNPNAEPVVQRFGRSFAPNDKVMQIENDYEKDVFNGDIGRVGSINRVDEKVVVQFDDKRVEYKFDELDSLQPAYAISVHKSQGSEYPAVVIALASHHYVMLQRNLLYTAVTRGIRLVVIVGDKKALGMAVRNDRIRRRHTRLAERLRGRAT